MKILIVDDEQEIREKIAQLILRLRRILENRRLQTQIEQGRQSQTEPGDWIGDSPRMFAIKELFKKVAPTTSPVLITGESGTGKEVIAKTIHTLSARAKQPFVAINLGGVPENLLESELFGYEKGAFRGYCAVHRTFPQKICSIDPKTG